MPRRLAVLTEGQTNPLSAKTAVSLLRYRGDEVVALIDSEQAGSTAQALLGCGGDTPIVAGLEQLEQSGGWPEELIVGVAPPGGRLPGAMRSVILHAAARGIDVTAGLHQFLADDPGIVAAAERGGATLWDVRKNDERVVADRKDLRAECLKIHTVGQDCSCGKMVASVEVALGLQRAGQDAKFVATGQTGILVAPGINEAIEMTDEERNDPTAGGSPIDCVVADFINGASERLIKRNQHHDILVIEGQATLVHPSYSSVTYGLLHGTLPDGLILCYEADRPHMHGRPHLPLTPLATIKPLYEHVANLEKPCKFIGVALNSRRLPDDAAVEAERQRVEDELGLPVCDVYREGPGRLVDAVLALKAELGKGS
ncbi:DUF1611 domain-containing protein [Algisphaera agarilytica]|uniref:Putative NAD-dependent epimerase/dehydratase family protein n=1 Tax=Algisphaera agarilytica TaxID=1385975 RepID=A0A7X0H5N2_9BACT|nr:DUF1611 domain-containing protein [Algisphaera agarilytica]MBB6428275.1 putative NAD-dependent epimerase/dehydratase family protein [Algisphaera agarilytica]